MVKKKNIFYGWWMVLGSAVLNFFAGGTFFYGFTVFFNPIRQTFGWSAAATSFAFVFQRLEFGIFGPLTGFLVDKIGPRKLMLPGWGLVGLGFLLMSRIDSLWAFYGSFLLISIGFSFGAFVVIFTAIANWFSRRRTRALTFIFAGFGASGLLVPLLALSIEQFSWRTSLIMLGIGAWLVGIPLSLLMRHKPEQYGYLPDGKPTTTANELVDTSNLNLSDEAARLEFGSTTVDFTVKMALRTRAFWLLAFAFFFQHIGTSAVMIHIVPYLESVRIPTAIAATAVTGMTLSSLIGRLGFGFVGDFFNKRYLIAIALVLQASGIFIFSFIDIARIWLIVPFLLTYGPGYGGVIPVRPALQADYFGTKNFGTIMGLMTTIGITGGLVSPVVAGWIFDTLGSYKLAWKLFALVTVPAIPLVLLAKPPKTRPEGNFT